MKVSHSWEIKIIKSTNWLVIVSMGVDSFTYNKILDYELLSKQADAKIKQQPNPT